MFHGRGDGIRPGFPSPQIRPARSGSSLKGSSKRLVRYLTPYGAKKPRHRPAVQPSTGPRRPVSPGRLKLEQLGRRYDKLMNAACRVYFISWTVSVPSACACGPVKIFGHTDAFADYLTLTTELDMALSSIALVETFERVAPPA